MINWIAYGQFMAMATSCVIAVAALIAGSLYKRAYFEMKKTKIIGSLMWLLYSIAFKFGLIVFSFLLVWAEGIDLQTFNSIQSIPNLIVIIALLDFVYRSISTPKEAKDCFKVVDKKDIRKL